ncbi:MAG: CPBP family intramembrane metalloprotease [Oligoflexia bacterium]|nr:CPBP family intramembrane metalloprotease [Oligoflexia bacterium]
MSYLLGFITGILSATCLAAPLVYDLIGRVLPGHSWPFSRVFDRVILFVLVVGLIIARKRFSLNALKPFFVRGSRPDRLRDLSVGVVVALLSASALLTISVGDELTWAGRSWGAVVARFPKLLVGALAVSVIEESLFRVLLFGKLARTLPVAAAAVIASLLYALAHFVTPDKSFVFVSGDALIGFEYVAHVLAKGLDLALLPAFAGLFLVGLVLCFSLMRTGSIYLGIGLHAGWVMAVKLSGFITDAAPGVSFANDLLRRYFLVARPEAWVSFLVVTMIVYFITQRRATKAPEALS